MECINQDQLGDQDGGALVMNCLPAVVAQIGNLKHSIVGIVSSSG